MYKLLIWVFILHLALRYIIGFLTEVTVIHFIISRVFLIVFIVYVWFYRRNNIFDYNILKSKKWSSVGFVMLSICFILIIRDVPGNERGKYYIHLIQCISVGIFEEFLFRYIVFTYLLKETNRYKYSIILASFLFALLHGTNLFTGATIFAVINQIEIAFLVGLFLQFIFLKTNNLVIVICIHALLNFLGSYNNLNTNNLQDSITISDFFSTQLVFLVIYMIFIPLYLWGLKVNNYR